MVTILFIILVSICLSGCTENITDKKYFIGSWDGRYETPDLAAQLETEATFYDENNTLKTVYYQLNNSQRTKSNTDFVRYELRDGEMYLKDLETNGIVSRVNYTFSNGHSTVTFTSGRDPDFIYVLTKSSD